MVHTVSAGEILNPIPLQITLNTDRLLLKSITPELIHSLYENETKEAIMAYFGFDEPSYYHFKDMHEKGMETHRISLLFFLLMDKETHRPIGECGFHTWNASHHKAELFYSMRKDEDKQKGYMTDMNLHRIEANAAAWNTPSIKLLASAGFVKEGTKREDYVVNGKNENSESFSLLKWEWLGSGSGPLASYSFA